MEGLHPVPNAGERFVQKWACVPFSCGCSSRIAPCRKPVISPDKEPGGSTPAEKQSSFRVRPDEAGVPYPTESQGHPDFQRNVFWFDVILYLTQEDRKQDNRRVPVFRVESLYFLIPNLHILLQILKVLQNYNRPPVALFACQIDSDNLNWYRVNHYEQQTS